jgi:molybdate transport system substrate-binding protein
MKRRLHRSNRLGFSLLMALSLVAGGSCHRRPAEKPTSAEKQSLSVYGPCFLSQPLRQVANQFESQHPNLDVRLRVDKPGNMLRKVLEKGERPPVFISQGEVELHLLKARGLVPKGQATRFAFSDLRLGLIVPRANPARIKRLEDLASDRVKRIVLNDPETTTLGHRIRQAFQRQGIWERVQSKAFFAAPDQMFLTYLTDGKAEAAVVYQDCLFPDYEPGEEKTVPPTLKLVQTLPRSLYDPVPCYAAVLEGTESGDLARSFVQFLASAEVQPILAQHHLVQEPAGP